MPTNNRTPNSTIYNRTSSWWKRRTKLEHKMLTLLIVISLVLLGFLIYVIVIHAVTPNVCLTPACILTASQIVKHINPSIQPCDDFFKFACGKFIRDSHGDKAAATVKLQQDYVDRQIVEIIKEPIQTTDSFWIQNQKQFFKACMNETAVEGESLNILNKLLEELQGWPVVMSFRWKEGIFDWKEMIYKLVRKGCYHAMMLNIWVVEDPIKNNRNIVAVREPYVSEIKEENKNAYRQFMVDVAVKFGADRGRAEIEMQRVLLFMEQLSIASSLNPGSSYDNIANTTTRYTVGNFSEWHKQFDWLEYINNVLHPVAKLSNEDHAVFPATEYVFAFFNLMERTEKRIVANYIIWSLIEDTIPYLSKELKDLQSTFNWKIGQMGTKPDRFKYCKSEIDKGFNPPPYQIEYARKYLPERKRKQVKDLVSNIKAEFVRILQKATWMDHASKIRAAEKAKDIVEIIGTPRDYFNDAILEQVPRNISFQEPVHNGTFFEMVLNHRKLSTDAVFFRLHMSAESSKLDDFFEASRVSAMYSLFDNAIVLPVGLLQGVFYNPERPMYINYGSLGSIIGHELTHSFGDVASKYGNDGDIWTNSTLDAFKENVRCIIEEANNYNSGMDLQINGTLTLEENLADYTGVKVSYEAYKRWVGSNGPEAHLIGIEYTPYQLFWISTAFQDCFADEEALDNPHALNAFRVIAPLRNNPNFATDFNCPEGSKMNPVKKCQIF